MLGNLSLAVGYLLTNRILLGCIAGDRLTLLVLEPQIDELGRDTFRF